jgi:4-hydroxy-3-polyprenylbenzoate decarboxylase
LITDHNYYSSTLRSTSEFYRRPRQKNGRIKAEVDATEIAEITDRVQATDKQALLFEAKNIDLVSQMPKLHEALCLALGVSDLDEIGGRIKEIVDPTNLFPGPGAGIMDKLQMLPKLAELSNFFPKTVKKAPCQDVVLTGHQVDLSKIPVLKCWPADGGRFITLPMVCTVDPLTRITNVGMYRMQVFDHQTTGMPGTTGTAPALSAL